tara:strand:+ start:23 stop:688 length:666 start_codon:yes stop_codon:yes gene_type:complete
MVCLIPARGGSKSIPNKNIIDVNGKPLIWWVLMSTLDTKLEKVYVATDSEEIKSVVESFGFDKVVVIGRSPETATDEATTESVMEEFANNYEFEDMMVIQPTSPLLRGEHIDEAIEKYESYPYDSLVSLVRQHNFQWKVNDNVCIDSNYNPANRPRRQDHKGYLVENGALYITNKEAFVNMACRSRLIGSVGYYEMPKYTSYEIDEEDDIIIVEQLLKKYD